MRYIPAALFRKKHFEAGSQFTSQLKRCLSVIDVMFLAVGQMLGAGIYVLTGTVVKNQSGPSVIFSFLLAGFAALLSAFSYAEFGARFPRAGSAYTYTYVGVGELWAFIIGWTMILEYMIGNAVLAVARAWSANFDILIDNRVKNFTLDTFGTLSEEEGLFARHLDILGFLLILLAGLAVGIGSKASANLNTLFVFINIGVIAFVVACGFRYADISNWLGETADGGSKFFPFGISGTLMGAATCFFSFVGFEALSTAGEEAKNPQRTIPLATFGSLGIISVIYVLMGSALTLMVPLNMIDVDSPYAAAFEFHGATVAKTVIIVGSLTGMLNNLVTGAFSLPRAVYAIADDGLIFKFFATVNKTTKVPLNAIIFFAILNAVLTAVFDLASLVEFLSIGTLLAYSIVSACVIILRYEPAKTESGQLDDGGIIASWFPLRTKLAKYGQGHLVSYAVMAIVLGFFWITATIRSGLLTNLPVVGYSSLVLSCLFSFAVLLFILAHRQNSLELSYKVPLVPFIPLLGLLINIFMMVYLSPMTWIRLVVWMALGLLIYFFYGIRHSKEAQKNYVVAVEMDSKLQSEMEMKTRPVSD